MTEFGLKSIGDEFLDELSYCWFLIVGENLLVPEISGSDKQLSTKSSNFFDVDDNLSESKLVFNNTCGCGLNGVFEFSDGGIAERLLESDRFNSRLLLWAYLILL